jgi:hypothetical protein
MAHENMPILQFVTTKFQTQAVQRIVDSWRVEAKEVVEKVVEHFREMGIYTVPGAQERLITESMVFLLRTSPEISRMVARARNEEIRRSRNRHAE